MSFYLRCCWRFRSEQLAGSSLVVRSCSLLLLLLEELRCLVTAAALAQHSRKPLVELCERGFPVQNRNHATARRQKLRLRRAGVVPRAVLVLAASQGRIECHNTPHRAVPCRRSGRSVRRRACVCIPCVFDFEFELPASRWPTNAKIELRLITARVHSN